jgi:hypothetical protein
MGTPLRSCQASLVGPNNAGRAKRPAALLLLFARQSNVARLQSHFASLCLRLLHLSFRYASSSRLGLIASFLVIRLTLKARLSRHAAAVALVLLRGRCSCSDASRPRRKRVSAPRVGFLVRDVPPKASTGIAVKLDHQPTMLAWSLTCRIAFWPRLRAGRRRGGGGWVGSVCASRRGRGGVCRGLGRGP